MALVLLILYLVFCYGFVGVVLVQELRSCSFAQLLGTIVFWLFSPIIFPIAAICSISPRGM
jgi:preprotein translocase subunit SecG